MKKIVTILLLCCFCIVPFLFSGCGESHSANEIISKYSALKAGANTSQFFSSNNMQINFTASNITNNANNIDSPVYVLFNMYEPMLKASSQMFSSKIGLSTFSSVVDQFSVGARNDIYNYLVTLETNLKNFASIKNTFEAADNPSGNFLSSLIQSYSDVLQTVVSLNSIFAASYFDVVISKRDYSSNETVIVSSDVDDILAYSKIILTDIMFNYYVKNYSLSNPAGGFAPWQSEWTYFNSYITLIKRTYSSSSTTSKQSSLKPIMATLYDTHENFVTNKNMFESALKDFPYKEFFYKIILSGENKTTYLEDEARTVTEKAAYNVVNNFMSTYVVARISGLNQLITYYIA